MFSSLVESVKNYFFERTFNKLLGVLFVIVWAFAIVYVSRQINSNLSALLLLVLTGIPALVVCLRYPVLGLYFCLLFSSLFAFPGRIFNILSPVGILVEVFTYMLWIAIIRKASVEKPDYPTFWKNSLTITLLIVFCFYILEVVNPAMNSKIGWLFYVRKQVSFMLFYFIAFVLLDSYHRVVTFLRCWVFIALVIAGYGIKQQWFGLASFERIWLHSDPLIAHLYIQDGFIRKFSFLTDPAAFGIICTVTGLFTFVMAVRMAKRNAKITLYILTGLFLLATAYSGTRTCFLMNFAGIIAYAVFTINERRTFYLMIIFCCTALVLMLLPLKNNPVLSRARTTFQGFNDASASVRENNRHAMQPYIHAHPFGGGLNTSSSEGQLYNPRHPLAGFPPDSGYMKILLEQGWIGLALNLFLYLLMLTKGIKGFYQSKKPMIKNIFLAITVSLFGLIVGQYSQIALAQYPLILVYYSLLAILIRLPKYDEEDNVPVISNTVH